MPLRIEALALTDRKMFEIRDQDPKLGFNLIRLIVARLLEELSEPGRGAAQFESSSVSQ